MVSGLPVRSAVALLIALVVVVACGGGGRPGGSNAPVGTSQPGQGTPPPAGQPTQPPAGQGKTCEGRPPAPPLSSSDLVGKWQWFHSWVYEDNEEYSATAVGPFELRADGTWDGSRSIIAGGMPGVPTVGPGTWQFDGYALTLTFDEGRDPETYDTVRIGSEEASDGTMVRNMSLEVAFDNGSCTVFVLKEET
jgi:hypothetical protein